jgi:CHRD domain
MRRLTLHATLIVALLVVFGAGSFALAHGNKRHIKSDDMSGYLEGAPSGPVSSVASGSFEARIDDANDEINYTLTYENLEAPVAQAHIHFGQRSVNGGISAWLCEGTAASPSASTPACPGQGGTVSGTITPLEVIGPTGHRSGRVRRARRRHSRRPGVCQRALGEVPRRGDSRPTERPRSARRLGRTEGSRRRVMGARLRPGSPLIPGRVRAAR